MLPAESAEISAEQVHAVSEVSPGKHVGRRGEDVPAGTTVLQAGRRLRPQDLGLLSSIGRAIVPVVRRPVVRVVITGNELLPPGSAPCGFRIADANGPMLDSLVQRDGGLVVNPGLVADEPEAILRALRDDADVILVSGGSSVGQEDLRRACWPSTGIWPSTASPCDPVAPRAWERCKVGWSFCFLETRCLVSAPTTSSRVGPSAFWAAQSRVAVPLVATPLAPQTRLDHRTTRLRSGPHLGRHGRTAGHRRGIRIEFDHAGRWFCADPRRQRRLSGRRPGRSVPL